jgi:tRNA pseudouridine55 synthase
MKASEYHGLLVIDKPAGVTSRDVVNRVQKWFPRGTRIGHTGTLDPLATGVLVICIGKATRLAEFVQRMKKTYVAQILLGGTSETDDAEGTITPNVVSHPPDREAVTRCLQTFTGKLDQRPPAFSAAKLSGRRAYDLARRGKDVELESRSVQIYSIDLLHYGYPTLEIRVHCGKGTYIRSLARDLGQRLGVGGYIQSLRRISVGSFDADNAILMSSGLEARDRLLPVAIAVSELPAVKVNREEASRLAHGQKASLAEHGVAGSPTQEEVAIFDARNDLIGVAWKDGHNQVLIPDKILAQD